MSHKIATPENPFPEAGHGYLQTRVVAKGGHFQGREMGWPTPKKY
jgi:hypothetical protein